MTEQDDLYADLPRICSQDTLMGVLAHQLCLQSAVNLDNMQLAQLYATVTGTSDVFSITEDDLDVDTEAAQGMFVVVTSEQAETYGFPPMSDSTRTMINEVFKAQVLWALRSVRQFLAERRKAQESSDLLVGRDTTAAAAHQKSLTAFAAKMDALARGVTTAMEAARVTGSAFTDVEKLHQMCDRAVAAATAKWVVAELGLPESAYEYVLGASLPPSPAHKAADLELAPPPQVLTLQPKKPKRE